MTAAIPRIQWAASGDRLLTCLAGVPRMHGVDGALERELGADYLDARWLDGGGVIAVDRYGHAERFTMHGAPYGREPHDSTWRYARAAIDARGLRVALVSDHDDVVVATTERERRIAWRFDRWDFGLQPESGRTTVCLSEDGAMLALGYETRAWESGADRVASGRGFLVIALDTAPDPERSHRERARASVVDRYWYECVRDDAFTRFAFDAGPRKRLAIATPEREPGFGTIRLDAGELYPRAHLGGARAVALDGRGLLAAFAYPTGVGERRLRVDYLAPRAKGPVIVELADTLWLDPDCEPVALAFDPDGRRIACLAADGGVEVVPVP